MFSKELVGKDRKGCCYSAHLPTKAITIIIIEENLNVYPINSNNIIFSNSNSNSYQYMKCHAVVATTAPAVTETNNPKIILHVICFVFICWAWVYVSFSSQNVPHIFHSRLFSFQRQLHGQFSCAYMHFVFHWFHSPFHFMV